MQALRLLFSPWGRMRPQAFILAAITVYVAVAASQLLTAPAVTARSGLWLFAAAQALLIWIWYAIHARRLHDAGRASALAAGAGLLYALSIVLLLIVASAFFTAAASGASHGEDTSALSLILLVTIIATLSGSNNYDVAGVVVAIFAALAFLPAVVAVAVSFWAATRPSAEERAA